MKAHDWNLYPTKACLGCGIHFTKDGYPPKSSRCPQCKRDWANDYYKKSPEKTEEEKLLLSEKKKYYKKNNKEYLRMMDIKWKKNNRDRTKLADTKYRKKNLGKDCLKVSMRRAKKMQATPSWANEFFMEEAYSLSRLRTKITGFSWHVDHIVPLGGKNVCGLHVENNLQVIPAVVNAKKGATHHA